MPTKLSLVHMLPELGDITEALETSKEHARMRILTEISVREVRVPIMAIEAGSQKADAPVLVITGGVHGLERIGSRVVIAYMRSLLHMLAWDDAMRETLQNLRVVFVPIVNPGGMLLRRRSNPQGVDLMRNAPIERQDGGGGFPFVAGHRIGPWLPWYRGSDGAGLEVETRVLLDYLREQIKGAPFVNILDVHSGFGIVDRLWIPFANTKAPFPHAPECYALKTLLDDTFPNHIYRFEPQSAQYTTHGDFWDYFYKLAQEEKPDRLVLPLALELGSWIWIKKNPRQILTATGMFNPITPHRHSRILRRHLVLFDFLVRATVSNTNWAFPDPEKRAALKAAAHAAWY